VTTGRTAGSSLRIAHHLRKQQVGSLERLSCSTVPQLGVRQQVRRRGHHVDGSPRHGKTPWRFDHQQVAATSSGLGDESLLDLTVVEDANGRVDLRLGCSEVVIPLRSGVCPGQGPALPAFSKHRLQPRPDLRLVIGSDLEPALGEPGTKHLRVGLHPERHQGRLVG
jgi:hypothetical protein